MEAGLTLNFAITPTKASARQESIVRKNIPHLQGLIRHELFTDEFYYDDMALSHAAHQELLAKHLAERPIPGVKIE